MPNHFTSDRIMVITLALAALTALVWLPSDVPQMAYAAPDMGLARSPALAGTVITVCASGCDYSNIQDAVEAAPYSEDRVEIKIADDDGRGG